MREQSQIHPVSKELREIVDVYLEAARKAKRQALIFAAVAEISGTIFALLLFFLSRKYFGFEVAVGLTISACFGRLCWITAKKTSR